ncbi:FtsB family cell division protein [Pseudonocardia spinosispora]|uniref:FtsB family cell division protein n=1 Tax=Pseudonocardia spinosispora TaxID=103441 RepID=UPI000A040A7A|nr:septum formation initiator family protein [Pseudonocardia spinosispora]
MPAGDTSRARAGRNRPARGPRSGAAGGSGRTSSTTRAAERPPGGRVRSSTSGEAIRGGRAHRVAVATSGMLGVSSTRRAAVLALVVCALALTVAVPLRNFLTQRQELGALQTRQEQLTREVEQQERRRAELRDPAHVQAEARERLNYVRPGDVPFIVQLPGDVGAPTGSTRVAPTLPWFERLWSDVRGAPK